MTLDDAPDVLLVAEAAALARVGRNAMYQAVARGEIFSVRIGRSVRIPRIALERFLGLDVPAADSAGSIDRDHMPPSDPRSRRATPSAQPAGLLTAPGRADTSRPVAVSGD